MEYFSAVPSDRTFNFLDFVQQFFTTLNFTLLPIRKVRGPGRKIKPLLSVVLSLKALF